MDIAKSIGELLFEKKLVVVPGFGGFTTDYKGANIDFVQSSVAPPSKNIQFNDNLKLNDGVLVDYLQKTFDVSASEAEKAIANFVANIKQTLSKKEIIELPKVGRLYLDYENKMKFLPEGTNFNLESFALPTITAKQIIRRTPAPKAAVATAAAPNAKKTPSYSQKDFSGNWSANLLWILLILALCVIIFSLYSIFSAPSTPKASTEEVIDETRINKSPSEDMATIDDPEDEEDFAMDNIEEETAAGTENEDINDNLDTEAETLPPTFKEAFIIIHSFGKKKNAERFIKKLNKDGFNPASVKEGGLYKVGVEYVYQTTTEFEEMLTLLKSKYDSNLVVWEGGIGKAN